MARLRPAALAVLASVLVLAGCNRPAPGEVLAEGPGASAGGTWSLVADASRLSFVSVKGGDVAEVHHFAKLSGGVAPDGTATLEIPLDSVETGIPVRNARMREFLFETGRFPAARVTARIDFRRFDGLAVGDQLRLPLAGELSLHGVTAPIETEVSVIRAGPSRVVVASRDPIIVNAATFGLGDGVLQLMKLANLDSITADVPVTFQLTFARRP